MMSYKPGQVSALLFAGTKKVVSKNDSLTKLFSSKKSSSQITRPTVLPASQISPALDNPNVNGPSPKLKIKKKKKHTKNVQHEDVEKSTKVTSPIPYTHQGSVQEKQTDSTPVKSLKRKLDKSKNDENEYLEKRPRRNRIRDKDADTRTIFVGNCPLTTDKKILKKLFREFGEIETIRFRCAPSADPTLPKRATVIMKNFHDQCNNFVSYVVFKDEESAKQALVRNGYLLDGLHLRVDIAAQFNKHDKKRSIFVGNLPFTISEEVVRSHFCDCGDIINVRIVRDRTTNLGKGICYVQFESKDSVGLAMKLNKTEVQGRQIRVMICTNKPKKKEGTAVKQMKNTVKSGKPKARKITFAPSNVASSKFQTILKTKKERRFRKMKKKKTNAKKQDGLSSIFGDMPATSKNVKYKKPKRNITGKNPHKSLGTKKRALHKGSSLNGKWKGKTKQGTRQGKPKHKKTRH